MNVTPNGLCLLGCPPYAIRGTDINILTSIGDGYLTAVLGAVISALAVVLVLKRAQPAVSLGLIAASAVGVLAVSSYALFHPAANGPTIAPYVLAFIGAAVSVIATALAQRPLSD